MPATRTAPTFVTAATRRQITLGFMDASGERWAGSLVVPVATTAAALDDMVADIVEKSNATLWYTEDHIIREGAKLKSNALNEPRSPSVKDHVLLTYKDLASTLSKRVYVPAPIEAIMVAGTDTPDLTALNDLILSTATVLGGGFVFRSARYSETVDINAAVEPE